MTPDKGNVAGVLILRRVWVYYNYWSYFDLRASGGWSTFLIRVEVFWEEALDEVTAMPGRSIFLDVWNMLIEIMEKRGYANLLVLSRSRKPVFQGKLITLICLCSVVSGFLTLYRT